MESRVHRLRIGPFRLVQRLDVGPLTERWLALNEREESTHVAHRIRPGADRAELRRLVEGMERLSGLSHPHILPIEHFTLERSVAGKGDGAWIVTPYTGSPEGLLTLPLLREHKGGQMAPVEVERTLTHLLEASEHAHAAGFRHGPVSADEILVDRRGSVSIELYGLRRIIRDEETVSFPEVERDEVRSIVEIGYWLLTGLSAEEPRIRADRLVQRLDHRWDEWFDAGLDPMGGYLSAGEALSLLPGLRREVEIRTNPVRSVLGTVRRVLGVS